MKRIARILIGLVVLLLVLGVVGVLLADTIARQGIERGGTEATGTEVSLDRASLALLEGGLALDNLSVANPDGYASDQFLTLGQGSVTVVPRSLMTDDVRIASVRLSGMELDLEQDGGTSNVREILEHTASERAGEDDDADVDEETEDATGRRVTVEELTLDDTHVVVRAGVAGEQVTVELRLDGVELRDVGTETAGEDVVADVLGLLLEAVMLSTLEASADALPEPLDGEFADRLTDMAPEAGISYEHVDSGSVSVEDVRGDSGVVDAIEDAVDDAVDELEDLF